MKAKQPHRNCHLTRASPFNFSRICIKILTNEKRGGLTVVSIDRSPFKLFSLWFSYKSMQAPFCKRPKTNQRTLILSFAINYCFPTSDENLLAVFELIWGIFYHCKTTIRYMSFVWRIFSGPSPILAMTLKSRQRCY